MKEGRLPFMLSERVEQQRDEPISKPGLDANRVRMNWRARNKVLAKCHSTNFARSLWRQILGLVA